MKKNILLIASFLMAFASCSEEYDALNNAVYFGEAQNVNSKTITVKDDGAHTGLYANLAFATNADVNVELAVDQQVLDEYNQKHGTNYLLLPENYYSFSSTKCTIKAGEISSNIVGVNVKAFGDDLDVSEKYAIPVKIKSASGIDILNASGNMLIICNKIIKTHVMVSQRAVTYEVQEGDNLTDNLQTWTVEFLTYSTSFSLNRHILSFKNPDNKVGLFARFGEYDHPVNEIQFKVANVPFYGLNKFDPNKWYHVALTCDGTTLRLYQNGILDLTKDHPEPNSKMTWKSLMIRCANYGSLSEFRIWGVARTQSEIVNNMYAVNPKSEGLITYWKINEGGGDVIHDYTGNGRDLPMLVGTWQDQSFPPEY